MWKTIAATLATCLLLAGPAQAQTFDWGFNSGGQGGTRINIPGLGGGPQFGWGENGIEYQGWGQDPYGGAYGGTQGRRYPGGAPPSPYGPGKGTWTTRTQRGGLPPTATSAVGLNIVEAGSYGGNFMDFGGWDPLGGGFPGGGILGGGGGGYQLPGGGNLPFPGGGNIPFPGGGGGIPIPGIGGGNINIPFPGGGGTPPFFPGGFF